MPSWAIRWVSITPVGAPSSSRTRHVRLIMRPHAARADRSASSANPSGDRRYRRRTVRQDCPGRRVQHPPGTRQIVSAASYCGPVSRRCETPHRLAGSPAPRPDKQSSAARHLTDAVVHAHRPQQQRLRPAIRVHVRAGGSLGIEITATEHASLRRRRSTCRWSDATAN